MPRQSAAIPYRRGDDERLEVLLVTARRSGRWVLPKGSVRPGFLPDAVAAKEAFEEGGVVGEVSRTTLTTYQQTKRQPTGDPLPLYVEVYPLAVTTEVMTWPEMSVRKRAWFPIDKAIKRVRNDELRRTLRVFRESMK